MFKHPLLGFVTLLAFTNVECVKSLSEVKKDILDHILPKNPNDLLIAPGNGTNGPTDVKVFLHVKSIDNINEEKMELTTRLIVRQIWKDYRLRYSSDFGINNIVVNNPKVIWTPDIYFSNLLKGTSYDVMQPTTYLKIYPDGSVLYSKCVLLTTSCPMDFKKFPFDFQTCDLLTTTYGSTVEDIVLQWKDTAPVTLSTNIKPRLFQLEKLLTHSRSISTSTGKFTTLVLSFAFKRMLKHYIIHIFLPCLMMVLLSWVSLWIPKKQLTARLLLGLSTLLTSTILIYDYNKNCPKISYSTLLDCFTGSCLTFMFLIVLESTVVYLLGEIRDTKAKSHEDNNKVSKCLGRLADLVDKIDCWTRPVLLLAYLAYCGFYFGWGIWSDTDNKPVVVGNHTTAWITF